MSFSAGEPGLHPKPLILTSLQTFTDTLTNEPLKVQYGMDNRLASGCRFG